MAMEQKGVDLSVRIGHVINPRAYLRVNIPAISVATITYNIWIKCQNKSSNQIWCWQNILSSYVIANVRGYFYILYLYYKFRNRPKYFAALHAKMESERSLLVHISTACMRTSFSACLMEVGNMLGTFYLCGIRDEFNADKGLPYTAYGCAKKLALFLMQMFVWEILFDFGHYWTHRMAHSVKWLYELGHIKHHENICVDAWDGLNVTFDDAVFTNWVPHMLSMLVTTKLIFRGRPFSVFEYHLLASYKTFVEVTGHIGVDFKGHSFPMCPPFAYFTGIDIGTAAYHSVHHRFNNCNYAKRFTIWDRVFGTMRTPRTPSVLRPKKHDDKDGTEQHT